MTRLSIFFTLCIIPLASCKNDNLTQSAEESIEWIDLTYAFDSTTIYWPTAENFRLDTVSEGYTDLGYYYSAFAFSAAEHGGTHLDAPVHFAQAKKTVDQLSIEQLVGDAIVVDVSDKSLADPDYRVQISDFEDWEQQNGKIPDQTIILIRTGYGKFWPDPSTYMGTSAKGPEAIANLHFPGLHPDAANWLVVNRKIKAIGLDTPSIDYGQSRLFESHQMLFKENIPVFENVANLNKLPVRGIWVAALPMKITGGSGSPLRIVAKVTRHRE